MATQLKTDPFKARDTFETGAGKAGIYRLSKLQDAGLGNIAALPYSIRVLLESLLAIKRAGADLIISYFAEKLATLIPK